MLANYLQGVSDALIGLQDIDPGHTDDGRWAHFLYSEADILQHTERSLEAAFLTFTGDLMCHTIWASSQGVSHLLYWAEP